MAVYLEEINQNSVNFVTVMAVVVRTVVTNLPHFNLATEPTINLIIIITGFIIIVIMLIINFTINFNFEIIVIVVISFVIIPTTAATIVDKNFYYLNLIIIKDLNHLVVN